MAQSAEPVLIVAWDMPFITVELLRALVAGTGEYDVFLPQSRGPLGLEPLCGIYQPACVGAIEAALEEEDYRTGGFHDKIRLGTLPLDEVEQLGDPQLMFFNVNTPDDVIDTSRCLADVSADIVALADQIIASS